MLTESDTWNILKRLRDGERVDIPVLHSDNDHLSEKTLSHKMIALANTETGGVLFLGVKGPPGWREVDGGANEYCERLLGQAAQRVEPPIEPSVFRDRNIIAVSVDSVRQCPAICHERGGSAERSTYLYDRGDIRLVSKDEYLDLLDRQGESDFELAPLGGSTRSDLDADLLARSGVSPGEIATLSRLGILDTIGLAPTITGLICFGRDEALVRYPNLNLWFTEYDHGAAECESRRFESARMSPLSGRPTAAVTWLASQLSSWAPRSDRFDQLHEVLRELIVNAIGHRAYAPHRMDEWGYRVEVTRYADQIRVTNPGSLPIGRVRILGRDQIKGRYSRNPRLMRLLQKLGFARQQDLGLSLARQSAQSVGCRIELIDHADRFEARLIVDPTPATRSARSKAPTDSSRPRLSPAERHERILDALEDGPLSARELAESLGWPTPTLRVALRDLVKAKLVRRTKRSARSPNQRYKLAQ